MCTECSPVRQQRSLTTDQLSGAKKPAQAGFFVYGGEGGIDSFAVASGELTQRGAPPFGSASKLCSRQSLSNLRFSSLQFNVQIKTPPRGRRFYLDGGEGGIRTLDTLLTYTPLAGERLQPLGHFSKFCLTRFVQPFPWRSRVARYSVLSRARILPQTARRSPARGRQVAQTLPLSSSSSAALSA